MTLLTSITMASQSPSTADFQVEPVSPQRIFQGVDNQLRRNISAGKLKPGDQLPAERELENTFGVSRNIMRMTSMNLRKHRDR